MTRVAIVGMACRYPDADSTDRLWQNVLARRRAFRRLPDERLRLADYWSPDPSTVDTFYSRMAAVLTGYEFDRVAFKVAGSTYRSTDLTHWLALDVASQALADAGFPDADGLPRDRTAVIIGNTLTGEFSRANALRLRWPYVRRVLAAALRTEGWTDERLSAFLSSAEEVYKAPFPPIDEDTLVGGLSNTIAGRICNHFDLHGGGYTVDGACCSSLLSVITACRSLVEGDVTVALAGGVDLSIDPFELVGFARTGALARREMRVYDRGSNGFWPGEGCGVVVLMRERDAVAAGHRVYATIAGWGVSSDGRGGISRPEAQGHRLALDRAYRRAGFGIETVPLFEGHGTGTEVGDATELRALSDARRAADPLAGPAAIGSIKAMIGHTKAAAGVAGLIKATLAIHHGVVPAAVGCREPHPELTATGAALRVVPHAEPWPDNAPSRAGVTALGFGGINTHVVLDGPDGPATPRRIPRYARTAQDAELLLADAPTVTRLRDRLAELARAVSPLSYAELGDLAFLLERELADRPYRAAVVADSPDAAERALTHLVEALDAGRTTVFEPGLGAFSGYAGRPARLGYLFPGQGSSRGAPGGALRRRFAGADDVLRMSRLPDAGDAVATDVAQPRIVAGSLAALRVLTDLGLEATIAVGHSLGELTALHWAGALDADALYELATARGAIMAESPPGAMLGIAADPAEVAHLLADYGGDPSRLSADEPVVIAGYNGLGQTVVAGPPDAVARVARAAASALLVARPLAVSHAFHSPLMATAGERFGAWLAGENGHAPTVFGPLVRPLVSTVTGALLAPTADLRDLLQRQITAPVRFADAVAAVEPAVDLFVEVGPGQVLTGMVRNLGTPAVSVDSDSASLTSLLTVLGAAYVAGAPLDHHALFDGRPNRPLDLSGPPRVLANPCETVPAVQLETRPAPAPIAPPSLDPDAVEPGGHSVEDALAVLLRLTAERAELPVEVVDTEARLLDDLHFSSITVGQLINRAARELGLPAVQAPTNFATATVRQLAEALYELSGSGDDAAGDVVTGTAPWVRAFVTRWEATPVPAPTVHGGQIGWRAYAPAGHPYAERLTRALERTGLGPGVVLCLPPEGAQAHLDLSLDAVRAAVRQPRGSRLVVVHSGPGYGVTALAKTARLDGDDLVTTVVNAYTDDPVDLVVTEVASTVDFTEVAYDAAGTRRTPVLHAVPHTDIGPLPLGTGDVLLATGGGKGITAECALALAEESGARLALLGRSDPARDEELAGNLARLAARGVTVGYRRADVTDAAAVRAAIAELQRDLGSVTAVLHGAGRNEPVALADLTPDTLRETLRPKLAGLRAVLDAVDPAAPRLFVTFGSIIGRAGLRGQGHYALANDWLAEQTAAVARERPGCRALCLEWSVWSGTGMGERLSVVEGLHRAGITPITPEQGVRELRRAIADPDTPSTVVISGRTGGLETLRYAREELPLLRFVAQPLVHYSGVELVTEAVLSHANDPYLEDHCLEGNALMPAVLGMEAIAQVGSALTGWPGVPAIEGAEFVRPIVVARDGATTIRIAASTTGPSTVDVAIRSDETGYAADHFRATLRWCDPDPAEPAVAVARDLPPIAFEPGQELYGGILFQGKRFQRLARYRRITAHAAEYDVAVGGDTAWFSPFLPGQLLLGDPGTRDAVLHGIQVCVPDAVLLPAGVERIEPAGARLDALDEVSCVAVERSHSADTYVYDVAVRDRHGALVERWTGLRLHAVGRRGTGPWPGPLVGPLLHRPLATMLGREVAIATEPGDAGPRRATSAAGLTRLLGYAGPPRHRPDGCPEWPDGTPVSAGHTAGLTLVATTAPGGSLGCDLEDVVPRTAAAWADLLGPRVDLIRLVVRQLGEAYDVAATRVWCAVECLRKAGRAVGPTLSVEPAEPGPWQVLTDGRVRVATVAVHVRGRDAPTVVAVLAGEG